MELGPSELPVWTWARLQTPSRDRVISTAPWALPDQRSSSKPGEPSSSLELRSSFLEKRRHAFDLVG